MEEISRLNGSSDPIELDFVERVATPKEMMELAIHLHLCGLSISNTVSVLDRLGISRARSTIHNWVQKADLEPEAGREPGKIALDETVIKVNGERFWLYSAVDVENNEILYLALYPSRTTALTKMFLRELGEKHDVEDAEFFVDGAPWLHAGLFELGMHFRHETFGERNPVERVFQKIKHQTQQFYNIFSRASAESPENWLKALAWAWKQLI
ncbi:Transposase [Halanaeroarchaeum sp. HSR-CO]|uniref:IS6 family transposase n=1 Tax=Halanaeroarchaeum sp. HSR-CO TaxID=2866382 RepID=UPI00217E1E5A|nr:IS6 family transposase [Halanaeroarchaeum sp. HSR-CO]UWG48120.1 Transposase [Halanaeroarchaeum sp. HSR-CO]